MKFTPCQEQAHKDIVDWIKVPFKKGDNLLYTLSGFAGTGKSTLINYILRDTSTRCVVSAPTHKAKKIIADFTGKKGETIQSLLGLRPNIELTDFDPNKPVFDNRAEERIRFYNLVIIDEASMINKDAFDLIKEKAIQYRTMILFSGDDYQLPPIGEKISEAFRIDNISYLKTIVRQSNENPNKKLLEIIRDDIGNGTNRLLPYLAEITQDIDNKNGFAVLNRELFYNKMLEYHFDSEYEWNPDFTKILCYKNVSVTKINRFIRNKINPSDEYIQKGDLLMGYRTISRDLGKGAFETTVENSRDYIVENVDIVEQVFLGTSLKGYRTYFKDIKRPTFILHKDSYSDFVIEYENRLQKAKMFRAWRGFYNFKDRVVVPENLTDDYGKFVVGKDIDYGYAITVHKSQGSTYNNVGILLNDILSNRNALESKKLMYVALSRTQNMNVIYNG